MGHSAWGHEESDMAEHMHAPISQVRKIRRQRPHDMKERTNGKTGKELM